MDRGGVDPPPHPRVARHHPTSFCVNLHRSADAIVVFQVLNGAYNRVLKSSALGKWLSSIQHTRASSAADSPPKHCERCKSESQTAEMRTGFYAPACKLQRATMPVIHCWLFYMCTLVFFASSLQQSGCFAFGLFQMKVFQVRQFRLLSSPLNQSSN